jgi:hypothetical protein
VYAEGDAPPDLASGQISNVVDVWVNENGDLVALVEVTGGPVGVTGGLLTATVDEAGVVAGSKHGVIYTGRNMADTGISGLLVDLFSSEVHLRAGSNFYFAGATDVGETALWRVGLDGTGLLRIVGTGDSLPGALAVMDVYATEVDASGGAFAFVASLTEAGAPRGLFTGQVAQAGFDEIALEGDALLAPDVIDDIPDEQAMVVYSGAGGAAVVYRAVSDLGQDYLILGQPDPTDDILIAREGQADSLTSGTFGGLAWLRNAPGASRPLFRAELNGLGATTFGVYSLESVNFSTAVATLALAIYNGRPAPVPNQAFGATFPGLGVPGIVDASSGASLAFSNVLSPSGHVGLFWLVRGTGLFSIALSGRSIPGGGDQYAADTNWRQTTATGVILYRAPLATAGSGIFRRGS